MHKNDNSAPVKNKKKSEIGKKIAIVSLFLLGLAIFLYPTFSNWYYQRLADQKIETFEKETKALSAEEVEERIKLAKAYNRALDPSRLADPFSQEEKEGLAHYAKMLEIHQMIGRIIIPQIKVDLPVYAGSSETVLKMGAGHLEGTSLPIGGSSTHAVITAHRGLPEALMFRDLDQLKKGDVFYFRNIQGVLAYQVDQILTVEPTDFEPVLVKSGKDYLTLLTCTPYMINSHRLLVCGSRVPYTPPQEEQNLTALNSSNEPRLYFFVALGLALLLLLRALYERVQLKRLMQRLDEATIEDENREKGDF